jgi:ferredoxin--NADP+ reductase
MSDPGHFVAIIGSGVAGSEAAYHLSQKGIQVALFEQHRLPYGKIEEGLPKWHVKLRNQEEKKIDDKIQSPHIHYIPKVRLGKDFTISQLLEWQFSAVLIAFGAWRDRPLPIENIDDYFGRGLYYQNPLVSWFNHKHEPDYSGPDFHLADNAIIIGGGLASLDVVKIAMLETVADALAQQNKPVDILTLEKDGIGDTLKNLKLNLSDLGLQGCTLYYRRRIIDMPLAPMPPKATAERKEKVYQVRERILKNYQQKYLFRVEECWQPVDKIVKEGRLNGIVFQRTTHVSGKTSGTDGERIRVESPLVISSIGSIPEKIPGLPYSHELLAIENHSTGQIKGFNQVFAIGNAVTGRGNIRESQVHGRDMSLQLMNNYLGLEDKALEKMVARNEHDTAEQARKISREVKKNDPLSRNQTEFIFKQIKEMQTRVGYAGNYKKWIKQNRPVRMEEMNNK